MTPLPGLSKAVLNATLYYERGGFSIRLNQSYRSKFLGEVTGFGAGRVNRNILAQGWLDGQIGYEFAGGALQGLALQFQVNNITGETMTTYQNNDVRQVIDWQSYGTQYLLGLSYKL
jgi:iron complex outermembrane receptor protein